MEFDLVTEIANRTKLLDAAVKQLGTRGRAFAEAERDYKIALAKKILEMRDKGTPVTIISDLCRGEKEIARLRFERDCAAINSYKLQLRLLDAQLQREWGADG